MNLNTLLKTYYYFLGVLTLGLTICFFFIHDTITFVKASESSPSLFSLMVGSFITWTVLMLLTSTVLLFSSKQREKMFLIICNAEAKDELEEKSINEAVKSTFFLNIVLFTLIVGLSSIGRHEIITSDKAVETSFAYNIPLGENKDPDALKKFFKERKQSRLESTDKHVTVKVNHADGIKVKDRFVPERLFSVYGLICFILFQFIFFRIFLFIHRREMFS